MVAGTAEKTTHNDDGGDDRALAEVEMYANVPGIADSPPADDPTELPLTDRRYIETGFAEMEDYLALSTRAIYARMHAVEGTDQSVFNSRPEVATGTRAIYIGSSATKATIPKETAASRTATSNIGPEVWLG